MTRGELVTFVLERLGVSSSRTAFVTQIQGLLNRIYVREVISLGLNLDESELVFTADDPIVNLPADWRRTETLRVAGRVFVEKTPADLMLYEAAAAVSGTVAPTETSLGFVTYYPPRRLRMSPVLDANTTTGTLIYHAAPALMDDDNDEPDVLNAEHHDLLGELAVYRMAESQEDPTLSQGALLAANLIRDDIREASARAMGSSTNRIRRGVYG